MKRVALLAGLLALGALAFVVAEYKAQQNVAEIEKVKDNLYVIKGGGGNTAAFITEKGVVVVDTKVPGWGQAILDKIRSVTDKPVTTIINTHTHADHVGSNSEFPATVEIVAHENCKSSMEKMPDFQGNEKSKFLPHKTYKDRLSLLAGNDKVDLYYFGRGHTGGDKGTPLIDVNNGGSGVEYPRTLKRAAEGIKGVDVVIPGHSAVTDWKAFQEYGDFNQDFLSAVQRAFKEGKTAEEAAGSLKLPDQYKDYGMRSLKDNVTKIYAELKQ